MRWMIRHLRHRLLAGRNNKVEKVEDEEGEAEGGGTTRHHRHRRKLSGQSRNVMWRRGPGLQRRDLLSAWAPPADLPTPSRGPAVHPRRSSPRKNDLWQE